MDYLGKAAAVCGYIMGIASAVVWFLKPLRDKFFDLCGEICVTLVGKARKKPPLSLCDISPALRGRQKPVRFRENASPAQRGRWPVRAGGGKNALPQRRIHRTGRKL